MSTETVCMVWAENLWKIEMQTNISTVLSLFGSSLADKIIAINPSVDDLMIINMHDGRAGFSGYSWEDFKTNQVPMPMNMVKGSKTYRDVCLQILEYGGLSKTAAKRKYARVYS